MELLGIDSWAGRAVFGLHAVFGLTLFVLGVNNALGGNLGTAGFSFLIGAMILIVGRSAGRIADRR